MSEGQVVVFRVGEVRKHPNADTLSITMALGGYPVIFRTGEYAEGDLAVYVPVDSIVPETETWAFLGKEARQRRIGAKRLRGVFSMGMLCQPPPDAVEGQDVGAALGITRWDDSEDAAAARNRAGLDTETESPKGFVPCYDLKGLRAWYHVLVPGEEVILTEKIHGESMRVFHDGTRLWVGSRTTWKKLDSGSPWSLYAARMKLEERLRTIPGQVVYGELYGNTELKYDAATSRALRVFDIFDIASGTFLDYDEAETIAQRLGFDSVPLLARGTWSEHLLSHGEGESLLGRHVREGFVLRPVQERVHVADELGQPSLGRVVLKFIGEGFMTRKGAR